MKIKEFWEIYEKIAKKNRFVYEGEGIRKERDGTCPVCAVANYKLHKNRFQIDFEPAAKKVGLPYRFASEIVKSADTKGRYTNKLLKLGRCG